MGTDTSESGASLSTLEVLYDAYHRQALGLAYRLLGNQADAEEVVQEAFLAAWRHSGTYDPARGSMRTWLLTLVRHQAIDLLRRRRRQLVQPLDTFELDLADGSDVAASAALHLDGAAARAALGTLPADQRQAVELAYLGGLSHSEIADQVGKPIGTVKGRIRLGLARLRLTLDSLDGGRGTPSLAGRAA